MGRSSARNRRSDAIAALIATAGSVRLRDLAQELGVSEMTLRRDAQFPDAGFACLGGYVVSASAGGAGAYDFDHALRRQVDAKRAAARQVLALLRPGAGLRRLRQHHDPSGEPADRRRRHCGHHPFAAGGQVADRRGGATLALISLVLLASGFQMMRVSNHLIDFIWGAFLILVVALNAWRQRRGTR